MWPCGLFLFNHLKSTKVTYTVGVHRKYTNTHSTVNGKKKNKKTKKTKITTKKHYVVEHWSTGVVRRCSGCGCNPQGEN